MPKKKIVRKKHPRKAYKKKDGTPVRATVVKETTYFRKMGKGKAKATKKSRKLKAEAQSQIQQAPQEVESRTWFYNPKVIQEIYEKKKAPSYVKKIRYKDRTGAIKDVNVEAGMINFAEIPLESQKRIVKDLIKDIYSKKTDTAKKFRDKFSKMKTSLYPHLVWYTDKSPHAFVSPTLVWPIDTPMEDVYFKLSNINFTIAQGMRYFIDMDRTLRQIVIKDWQWRKAFVLSFDKEGLLSDITVRTDPEFVGYPAFLEKIMEEEWKAPPEEERRPELASEEDVIRYLRTTVKMVPGDEIKIPKWGVYFMSPRGEVEKIAGPD
jgi:hypothetical protein